ncbi:hypothetical protein RFI_39015, partial [Reticulomyxa filosa]
FFFFFKKKKKKKRGGGLLKKKKKGFVHFAGFMASGVAPQFGMWTTDGSEMLIGGLDNSGVIALFTEDLSTSMVISPLDNFMAFNLKKNNSTGDVEYGIMGNVSEVPEDFSISFVVSVFNGGINRAMRQWGSFMLQYYNRDLENSWDRDFTLQYLGYSTDNGAFYYYHTEANKTYQQTIIDVHSYAVNVHVPYRYILLDSWWYYQGYKDGLLNWFIYIYIC